MKIFDQTIRMDQQCARKMKRKKHCWLFGVCAVVQLCSAELWINNIHILLNIMKMIRKREHIKHMHTDIVTTKLVIGNEKNARLGKNLTGSARFEMALVLFSYRCACVLARFFTLSHCDSSVDRPFIHLIFPYGLGPHKACLKKIISTWPCFLSFHMWSRWWWYTCVLPRLTSCTKILTLFLKRIWLLLLPLPQL